MCANRKHTTKELEKYIKLYLEEGKNIAELRNDFGLLLGHTAFREAVIRYQAYGELAIQGQTEKRHYSKEFKEMVIQEHLQDGIPLIQLARKYQLPSYETARRWLIKYTRGEEIRSYTPQPEVYKMTAKKITHEEKMAIVMDCLSNGFSYKDTAKKYEVSYGQVYSWVQKYRTYGTLGLVDSRGRRKPDDIQTAEEKLRTEVAALKARNAYLETENAALKKLEEVERELILQKRGMKRNTKSLKTLKKKDSK